jgi:hypothetical protein
VHNGSVPWGEAAALRFHCLCLCYVHRFVMITALTTAPRTLWYWTCRSHATKPWWRGCTVTLFPLACPWIASRSTRYLARRPSFPGAIHWVP